MKLNKLALILGLFLLPILANAQENKTNKANKQVNKVITQANENGVTFSVPKLSLDSTEVAAILQEAERKEREKLEQGYYVPKKPNYLTEQQWNILLILAEKNKNKSFVPSYKSDLDFDINNPYEVPLILTRIKGLDESYRKYTIRMDNEIPEGEKEAYEMIRAIWQAKYNEIFDPNLSTFDREVRLYCRNLSDTQIEKLKKIIPADIKAKGYKNFTLRCYSKAQLYTFKTEQSYVEIETPELSGVEFTKYAPKTFENKVFVIPFKIRDLFAKIGNQVFVYDISTAHKTEKFTFPGGYYTTTLTDMAEPKTERIRFKPNNKIEIEKWGRDPWNPNKQSYSHAADYYSYAMYLDLAEED